MSPNPARPFVAVGDDSGGVRDLELSFGEGSNKGLDHSCENGARNVCGSAPIQHVAFSPDGRLLAVDRGAAIFLVDVANDGPQIVDYARIEPPDGVSAMGFVNDQRLATGHDDGSISIWSIDSLSLEKVTPLPSEADLLAINPSDHRLLAGSDDGALWICDSMSTRVNALRSPYRTLAWAAAFSQDGSWLATVGPTDPAGPGLLLVIWDARTGTAAARHRLRAPPGTESGREEKPLLLFGVTAAAEVFLLLTVENSTLALSRPSVHGLVLGPPA